MCRQRVKRRFIPEKVKRLCDVGFDSYYEREQRRMNPILDARDNEIHDDWIRRIESDKRKGQRLNSDSYPACFEEEVLLHNLKLLDKALASEER